MRGQHRTPADFTTNWQTTGRSILIAVARWDPQTYWDCSSQPSEAELAQQISAGAGVTDWLVETESPRRVRNGSVAVARRTVGQPRHEVVRLGIAAEQSQARITTPGAFHTAPARKQPQRQPNPSSWPIEDSTVIWSHRGAGMAH